MISCFWNKKKTCEQTCFQWPTRKLTWAFLPTKQLLVESEYSSFADERNQDKHALQRKENLENVPKNRSFGHCCSKPDRPDKSHHRGHLYVEKHVDLCLTHGRFTSGQRQNTASPTSRRNSLLPRVFFLVRTRCSSLDAVVLLQVHIGEDVVALRSIRCLTVA